MCNHRIGKGSLGSWACLIFSFVYQNVSELFFKICVLSDHKKENLFFCLSQQYIHSVKLTLDTGAIRLTWVLSQMAIMAKKMVTNVIKTTVTMRMKFGELKIPE